MYNLVWKAEIYDNISKKNYYIYVFKSKFNATALFAFMCVVNHSVTINNIILTKIRCIYMYICIYIKSWLIA